MHQLPGNVMIMTEKAVEWCQKEPGAKPGAKFEINRIKPINFLGEITYGYQH
jgi:hypothetical protein